MQTIRTEIEGSRTGEHRQSSRVRERGELTSEFVRANRVTMGERGELTSEFVRANELHTL